LKEIALLVALPMPLTELNSAIYTAVDAMSSGLLL
jgi:hypothetical protein